MKLGVYGAGGLGREILELAKQINADNKRWDDIFFIDDSEENNHLKFNDAILKYNTSEIEFVIAVGEPVVREVLFTKIKNHKYRLATLIHQSIHIPSSTIVGEGTIICRNVFVSVDIEIHHNVLLQPFSSVAHDCNIGDSSVISGFVSLSGNCTVGKETYIGINVPVKQGVSIGSNTIVGMGSVVIRNIEDGVIALGNPARPMKRNEQGRVFK